MHETGHSGLVHWDDPERWGGKGAGRGVQDVHLWLTHVNVWREPLQFVKIISPQLKKKTDMLQLKKLYWEMFFFFLINLIGG